jgi:hypothetical protein
MQLEHLGANANEPRNPAVLRQTLPNKQISCDFRCGVPRRVQLSSKEQLVKTQLQLGRKDVRNPMKIATK